MNECMHEWIGISACKSMSTLQQHFPFEKEHCRGGPWWILFHHPHSTLGCTRRLGARYQHCWVCLICTHSHSHSIVLFIKYHLGFKWGLVSALQNPTLTFWPSTLRSALKITVHFWALSSPINSIIRKVLLTTDCVPSTAPFLAGRQVMTLTLTLNYYWGLNRHTYEIIKRQNLYKIMHKTVCHG